MNILENIKHNFLINTSGLLPWILHKICISICSSAFQGPLHSPLKVWHLWYGMHCYHRHFRVVLVSQSPQCHLLFWKWWTVETCSTLKMLEQVIHLCHIPCHRVLIQTPSLSGEFPHVICGNLSLQRREDGSVLVL